MDVGAEHWFGQRNDEELAEIRIATNNVCLARSEPFGLGRLDHDPLYLIKNRSVENAAVTAAGLVKGRVGGAVKRTQDATAGGGSSRVADRVEDLFPRE